MLLRKNLRILIVGLFVFNFINFAEARVDPPPNLRLLRGQCQVALDGLFVRISPRVLSTDENQEYFRLVKQSIEQANEKDEEGLEITLLKMLNFKPRTNATRILAELYFKQHKFDLALPLYVRAIDDDQYKKTTLSELAITLEKLGETEKAEAIRTIYRRFYGTEIIDIEFIQAQFREALKAGQVREARILGGKILAIEQKNIYVMTEQIKILLILHKNNRAIALAMRLAALPYLRENVRDAAFAELAISSAYLAVGDIENAKKFLPTEIGDSADSSITKQKAKVLFADHKEEKAKRLLLNLAKSENFSKADTVISLIVMASSKDDPFLLEAKANCSDTQWNAYERRAETRKR